MLFIEAIEKFRAWRSFKVKAHTVTGYDGHLRSFCVYLHNPQIENIGLEEVLTYFKELQECGWKPNSFVDKAMAFRKFFEFYKLQNFHVLNWELIPVFHKTMKMPRVMSDENYDKIFKLLGNRKDYRTIRNKALISLLNDTGMRREEILSLNVSDLDLEKQKARIKTEKAVFRKPFREVFWTRETNAYLEAYLVKRKQFEKILKDKDILFFSIMGQTRGSRLMGGALNILFQRLCEKAGIPHHGPHSLRHKFGRSLAMKGANDAVISDLLGHSNLESSRIYTMLDSPNLRKMYDKYKGR